MKTQPTVPLHILQWNCRSFTSKKHQLDLFLASDPADVVALQETNVPQPKLIGYQTFTTDPYHRTATFVQAHLPVLTHIIASDTPNTFVEILPTTTNSTSLFILNVYSPPTHQLNDVNTLIQKAITVARDAPFVLLGDFNAPHMGWGYHQNSKKGTRLQKPIHDHRLRLQNDLTQPTRIGNSVTRDTIPDLTLTKNCPLIQWTCQANRLGSDHAIISIRLTYQTNPIRIGQARITDWQKFREDNAPLPSPQDNLAAWIDALEQRLRKHTTTISLTTEHPVADPHLLHIWEARQSLTRRWRKQKHNKRLKQRIAVLNQQAQDYSKILQKQNWASFCNQLQSTLSTKKTWHILRSLIDKEQTRTVTSNQIHRLVQTSDLSPEELLQSVRRKIFGHESQYPPSNDSKRYTGNDNAELDSPFTMEELHQVLQMLKRNSAPGHDRITNRLLRNLDDETIQALLDLFNQHWETGTLPEQWKRSDIILIPKPHKSLGLNNLRPISLTSCVGKLFEHLVHIRLTTHLETTRQYPNTMFGFRTGLSTQDVLLQLKEQVSQTLTRSHPKMIMTLDVQGAFDNVYHSATLDNLATTHCGHRTFNYVKAFLHNRTATLRLGPHSTPLFNMPARGTPQGSVISPLLFNIALLHLPVELDHIPDLHHAFYADDITLWTTQGSVGAQQDTLQQAINTINTYLIPRGLRCQAEKSAVLMLRSRTRGRPPEPPMNPNLKIQNTSIPQVPTLRILGVPFHHDGSGAALIPQLNKTCAQLTHLIKRVSHQHAGLRENESCKLIQALLLSRITYGTPYVALKPAELRKLDILVRKPYKTALHLPTFTPTKKLLELGTNNTISELLEAQRTTQIYRLQLISTGRHLLGLLGHDTPRAQDTPNPIPISLRQRIHIAPIPRHMHPSHNRGRRIARVRMLQRRLDRDPLKQFSPTTGTSATNILRRTPPSRTPKHTPGDAYKQIPITTVHDSTTLLLRSTRKPVNHVIPH